MGEQTQCELGIVGWHFAGCCREHDWSYGTAVVGWSALGPDSTYDVSNRSQWSEDGIAHEAIRVVGRTADRRTNHSHGVDRAKGEGRVKDFREKLAMSGKFKSYKEVSNGHRRSGGEWRHVFTP